MNNFPNARLKVGLDDFRGLLQPSVDSVILICIPIICVLIVLFLSDIVSHLLCTSKWFLFTTHTISLNKKKKERGRKKTTLVVNLFHP